MRARENGVLLQSMMNYALTFYDAADRFAESESIACEDDVRAVVTAIQRLRSID